MRFLLSKARSHFCERALGVYKPNSVVDSYLSGTNIAVGL